MTLIPEFELAFWNGWWFTLIYGAVTVACVLRFPKGALRRLTYAPELSGGLKVLVHIEKNLFYAPMVYAAWVPIKFNSPWVWVGPPLFLLGMLGYSVSMIDFGSAPSDEPIVKGMYRVSRHPQYVTSFVAWIGAGLAMASWVILVANVILFVLMDYTNRIEERECLKQYGDAYRQYTEQVPRYLLFF